MSWMKRPDIKPDRKELIAILMYVFVGSAIFGFIYEEIFYYIDLGYLVKRGSTFGPWIPIYAFGGVGIAVACERIRKKPWAVFLVAAALSGILEFATGYVLFHFFNTRLWDYNVEIWNWLNIGGYVCFRSVTFFGLCALVLEYLLLPVLFQVMLKLKKQTFFLGAVVPMVLFCIDMTATVLLNRIVK